MTERGINSFEEFLLIYLFVGFVISLIWAVLEADVVLGPEQDISARRARRLRLTRVLAPLSVLHVAFGLLAADAARPDPDEKSNDGDDPRRRAHAEARTFLGLGLLVLLVTAVPHLPVIGDTPFVSALSDAIPWE